MHRFFTPYGNIGYIGKGSVTIVYYGKTAAFQEPFSSCSSSFLYFKCEANQLSAMYHWLHRSDCHKYLLFAYNDK